MALVMVGIHKVWPARHRTRGLRRWLLLGALDQLVQLTAIEPDTPTLWAIVDFDALAF
jgi:hypothetical protein